MLHSVYPGHFGIDPNLQEARIRRLARGPVLSGRGPLRLHGCRELLLRTGRRSPPNRGRRLRGTFQVNDFVAPFPSSRVSGSCQCSPDGGQIRPGQRHNFRVPGQRSRTHSGIVGAASGDNLRDSEESDVRHGQFTDDEQDPERGHHLHYFIIYVGHGCGAVTCPRTIVHNYK